MDLERLKKKLQELAAHRTCQDEENFCPITSWFGCGFEDCYSGGLADGKTIFARDLLAEFFNEKS